MRNKRRIKGHVQPVESELLSLDNGDRVGKNNLALGLMDVFKIVTGNDGLVEHDDDDCLVAKVRDAVMEGLREKDFAIWSGMEEIKRMENETKVLESSNQQKIADLESQLQQARAEIVETAKQRREAEVRWVFVSAESKELINRLEDRIGGMECQLKRLEQEAREKQAALDERNEEMEQLRREVFESQQMETKLHEAKLERDVIESKIRARHAVEVRQYEKRLARTNALEKDNQKLREQLEQSQAMIASYKQKLSKKTSVR